jgi:AraC family transcriptional regulator, transcriptional activator of pobA
LLDSKYLGVCIYCSQKKLNISPNYLGTLLRLHTQQNTQQHIQNKLIDYAKEQLSTTNLSVSEIDYELGFEHPQSFSKLFKQKNQSNTFGVQTIL